MLGKKVRHLLIVLALSLGLALGLTACGLLETSAPNAAAAIPGQLHLDGMKPDWHGFVVRVDGDDMAAMHTVAVSANGQFYVPESLLNSLSDRADSRLIAYKGRTQLALQLSAEQLRAKTTLVLTPTTTVQALAVRPDLIDELILLADTQLRLTLSQGEDALLDRYRDTFTLLIQAQEPVHLQYIRLRYHHQLASNYARQQGLADYQQAADMSVMLRLNAQGQLLRWQHLNYAQAPWACVDYFEKGARWSFARSWQLGVRLWAVEPNYQALTATQMQQALSEMEQQTRCGYQNWRLPTVDEVRTLTHKKDGHFEFPQSLPFTQLERFWVLNDANEAAIFDWATQQFIQTEQAQLLAFSFTADVQPPTKPVAATPLDAKKLRAIYSKPSTQWPAPTVDNGVNWKELGALPAVEFPHDNPYSEAKVQLGQILFFDANLSKQRNIACASCHLADQQWSDARKVSIGTHDTRGVRNAMPIVNTAYIPTLFWDGRVNSLEEQAVHPIMDKLEMALTLDELQQRLQENKDYPALFAAAFGDEAISIERYKKAVATFERTLISKPAAFDRFVQGDKNALTDEQVKGLHLYRTKARCMNCHSGPVLSDFTFRNTGLTYYGRSLEDASVFKRSFTQIDMGSFRVPPLRDIEFSAPYMHNGVFPVIAMRTPSGNVGGTLAFYNAGMTKGRNANYPQYQHKYDPFFPIVDDLIQPLGMTADELMAVDAFLKAVSAPARAAPAPLSVLENPASEIQ